jgi:hypothetical protein
MKFMSWFVRGAGIYNASAVIAFLTPGALSSLGVAVPASPFWVWLPALLGLFGGIVLFISASDLETYGSLPYWNGLIRLVFVVAAFSLDFGATAGGFVRLLALGDLPLALGCLVGLPRVLERTHVQMLANQRSRLRA